MQAQLLQGFIGQNGWQWLNNINIPPANQIGPANIQNIQFWNEVLNNAARKPYLIGWGAPYHLDQNVIISRDVANNNTIRHIIPQLDNMPHYLGMPNAGNLVRNITNIFRAQFPNIPLNQLLPQIMSAISRWRHNEIRQLLRAGQLRGIAMGDYITYRIGHAGHPNKIILNKIPPIISQASLPLLFQWMGNLAVANHQNYLDGIQNSTFRIPFYLDRAITMFMQRFPVGQRNFVIVAKFMVIDMWGAGTYWWDSSALNVQNWQNNNSLRLFWWNLLDDFWNRIQGYDANNPNFNEDDTLIWFSGFEIHKIDMNQNDYDHSFWQTKTQLKRYVKCDIQIPDGMCLWFAYYLLKNYHEIQRIHNQKLMLEMFLQWSSQVDSESELYTRLNMGDTTVLLEECIKKSIGYVLFDVESQIFERQVSSDARSKTSICISTHPSHEISQELDLMCEQSDAYFLYQSNHIQYIKNKKAFFKILDFYAPRKPQYCQWQLRKPNIKLEEAENDEWDQIQDLIDENKKLIAVGEWKKKINERVKVLQGNKPEEWVDCFVDFECYNCRNEEEEVLGVQKPYLIVLYNAKTQQQWIIKKRSDDHNPVDDLFQIIDDEMVTPNIYKPVKFRIIAHNGCKYDFTFLQQARLIGDMQFLGDAAHFKGIIYKNKIYFTDFFLFFGTSLNKLSEEWLGEKKLDHTDFSKITDENWRQYCDSEEAYCVQDVQLLAKLWQKFLDCLDEIVIVNDRERVAYKYQIRTLITISQLSLDVFKQCFINEGIWPVPPAIFEDVRNSYYGGWTYVNKMEPKLSVEKYGTYIDVNSHYPTIMSKPLPVKYHKTVMYNKPINLKDLPQCPPGYARLVQVSQWNVSPFTRHWHVPIRKNSGLYYVRNAEFGENEGWYWEEELMVGDKAFVKIRGYHMWEMKTVAADFVDYFYALKKYAKKTGNKSLEAFAKKLLNSLYGKMGQKPRPIIFVGPLQRIMKKAMKMGLDSYIKSVKKLVGDWWMVSFNKTEMVEGSGTRCQIASYITSQGRTILARMIEDFPLRFIYCDTDSIFLEGDPPANLLDDYELGKMKVEAKIKSFKCLGPKMYKYETIDSKISLHGKGIPTKLLTPAFFDKPTVPAEWLLPNVISGIVQVTRLEDRILWQNITKLQRPWCEKIQIAGKYGNQIWDDIDQALDHYNQRVIENKRLNVIDLERVEQQKLQLQNKKRLYGPQILGGQTMVNYPTTLSLEKGTLFNQILELISWHIDRQMQLNPQLAGNDITQFLKTLTDYYDIPLNLTEEIDEIKQNFQKIMLIIVFLKRIKVKNVLNSISSLENLQEEVLKHSHSEHFHLIRPYLEQINQFISF